MNESEVSVIYDPTEFISHPVPVFTLENNSWLTTRPILQTNTPCSFCHENRIYPAIPRQVSSRSGYDAAGYGCIRTEKL